MIINKVDPLKLDAFKYAFLKCAGEQSGDQVSITVADLRKIVRRLLNTDEHKYEERVIQALAKEEGNLSETTMVTFSQVQKFLDVYQASSAMLNESLADPQTFYHDPISGHQMRDMQRFDVDSLWGTKADDMIKVKRGSLNTECNDIAKCLVYLW